MFCRHYRHYLSLVFLLSCLLPLNCSAEIKRYDWLSDGEKTGQLTIDALSQYRRTADFAFDLAGYGPNIHEDYSLDASGLMTRIKISGKSYFGLTLDENFSLNENLAQWHSTTEQGSEKTIETKFYFPNEGTLSSWTALIRYALTRPQQSVELLPLGKLTVRKLTSKQVSNGTQSKTVVLYSASGFDFSPEYIWLDEQQELFAASYDNRWGALILNGWDAALPSLQSAQEKIEQQYWQTLAQENSHPLNKPLLIKNANIFDSKGAQLLQHHDVLIENGKIKTLAKKIAAQTAYQVIDASGKTLLPGLWDMHSHSSLADGVLNIAAGVTNVRDLGSDNDNLAKTVAAFNSNDYIGPRLYLAGFIDQKSERDISIGKIVETLEQAIDAVNWYADHNYQQIKLYSSINPDWIKPIAKVTHQRGLKLSGHVPAFINAERAIYDGFDEIHHLTMIFLNFLVNSKTDTRTGIRFTAVAEEGSKLNLNSKAVREFIELMQRKNTIVDPTLAGYIAMFTQRSGQVDPRYRSISEHFPPSVFRHFLNAEMDVNDDNAFAYRASAEALKKMVKKLYDSDIPLVAGTDALPGFTLHSELEAFAEAGIPNAKVLQIATYHAAKIAGADKTLGSIEPGKTADLILIDGNPVADIKTIRKISLVIKGDLAFLPAKLYATIGVKPFTASVSLK